MDKLTNQLVGLKYSKPKIYTFSPCLKMKIAIKSNSMCEAYYSRVFMSVPNCVYVCVGACMCVYVCVCAHVCICRHTEADEHAIQHCFCYTSTVLTSTLAFQKEQKLKVECQVCTRVLYCTVPT